MTTHCAVFVLFLFCIELDATLGDPQCEIQGKFKCMQLYYQSILLFRFSTFFYRLSVPNQKFTSDCHQTFGSELE